MRVPVVLGVIGNLLRLYSLAFLGPLALALYEQDYHSVRSFGVALLAAAAIGSVFARSYRAQNKLWRAEALAIVAGTWLTVATFSAIPYVIDGLRPVDAFFEAMSGLTTTGATVLTDFSAHDNPFYLWRAMTQWFGGLGVIALFVVVLPQLGIAGRQIFFAEASTAPSDGISPKIRDAARRLWILYVGLTAVLAVLLYMCGYGTFDAAVHALTTLSAGGFSPKGTSIQEFANPAAEWVLVVFMVISGTSFTLQWRAITRGPQKLLKDGEFLTYLGLMLVVTLGLWGVLVKGQGMQAGEALRAGAFQVTSLASSTGYASRDFELWSDAAKSLLVIAMVLGGCAGSACGGPKVIRYVLMWKFLRREMRQVLHPSAVQTIRYKATAISQSVIRSVITLVLLYFALYVGIGLGLVLIEDRLGLEEGMSASLACLGNIGPAFGRAGPMGSYAHFSDAGKLVLAISMWLGRLEIVTVLALLHPDVWRRLRWARPGAPAGA